MREKCDEVFGTARRSFRDTRGMWSRPENIPVEQYDVVITFDPIWDRPADSPTLFAYFVVEHWDRLYQEALRAPRGHYDLFLAHMLDAPNTIDSLPQPLAFPYLRDPDAVRAVFPAEKEQAVWADFRTLTTLGMAETYGMWVAGGHAAAERLEETLGLPVRYKSAALTKTHTAFPIRLPGAIPRITLTRWAAAGITWPLEPLRERARPSATRRPSAACASASRRKRFIA